MMKKLFAGSVAGIVMLGAVTAASANEGEGPSSAQLELNQQGVEAIIEEDFPRAVRLFQASLDLGELNITYLNMARALQRDGQCEAAEQAYGRALEAPPVERPSLEEVREAVAQFRDELRDECPGVLEVTCDPADLTVTVAEESPISCEEQSRWELMSGAYDIRGEYEDQTTEANVTIEALRTTQLQLGLDAVQAADPIGDGIAEVEAVSTWDTMEPWVWFAAGAVALGAGIALDTVPDRASNYELDPINFAPPGLYLVGAGATFMGVRALLRD